MATRLRTRLLAIPAVALCLSLAQAASAERRCDIQALQRVAPVDVTIVAAGRQAAPAPHCHVKGFVTSRNPGPNDINFELALPEDWTNRYYLAGNGGAGGSIQDSPSKYVTRGMAAVAHDTGHAGEGADWTPMLKSPAKKIDWGYRSEHLVAVATQHLTRAYYDLDNEKMYRYFRGCSKGGGQALNLLQNYPGDFDGIVAGTSGIYHVPLLHAAIGRHILGAPGRWVSPGKLKVLEEAVLKQCDGLDGARDGILADPGACAFEPEQLQCTSKDGAACLTAAELSTVKLILGGLRDGSGQEIYPGFSISNVTGWAPLLTGLQPPDLTANPPWPPGEAPQTFYVPERVIGHFFRDDLNFNLIRDFDPSNPDHVASYLEADRTYNAQIGNPNIQPFKNLGGKIFMWAGWADNSLSPYASIRYYKEVENAVGGKREDVQSFARLFMAPGVLHCRGGTGPQDVPDRALEALIDWVEEGAAPDAIIANRPAADAAPARSFRLCPYPQTPRYHSGDVNAASSWRCVMPGREKR